MSVKRYKFPKGSAKWLQFRLRGYGGSEIASVLAQYSEHLAAHTYSSPAQVHLEKIGEPVPLFHGNIYTRAGHHEERDMINAYRYYDFNNPSVEEMYDRMDSGGKRFNKVIGTDKTVNTYVNDKYPWLFYSEDAVHYTGNGKINVECKNTNSMETGRYEGGLNPSFVCQVQQGLIVTGHKMARIIMKVDGVIRDPIDIVPDKEWQDFILEYSYTSWQNVLAARQIKVKYGIHNYFGMGDEFMPESWKTPTDELEGNSPIGKLMQLEPEFIGVNSEFDFISKMIIEKADDMPMEMTDEQWEMNVKLRKETNLKLKHENECAKLQLDLIRSLNGYNKSVLASNEKIYFTYKPDKNGKKTFRPSNELKNI